MARKGSWMALALAVVVLSGPRGALAQAADHQHDDGAADHAHAAAPAAHDHSGPIVSCTDLASPPWTGLPAADRQRIAMLREATAALATPEAAIAAGFRPALGEIPGMGVHYVHRERSRDGVRVEEPDHLLFSEVDGEQRLVGAAYAFVDAPSTAEPIPFESDLAHWHDHPQFAPDGQTLHMLHVWFVPSSNGPFAGLNFWLPFEARGVTPPSACWMTDADVADKIQRVSFALARPGGEIERAVVGDRGGAAAADAPSAARQAILADLGAAARAGDLGAWNGAADRLLADLSPAERMRAQMMLRVLTDAQMSSTERDSGHDH